MLCGPAGHEHRARDVRRKHGFEAFTVKVNEVLEDSHPGIVHKNVEVAELLYDLAIRPLDVRLHRYVRNPMYVAVTSLIFGQGLLLGSVALLEYGLVVWLGFFAFVLLYEEPALRGKFGKEYEDYCARVPRWIPRFWSKRKPFAAD